METFSWSDTPNQTAFPVARPGYPFIFSSAFTTAVFALLGLTALALIGLFVTFFIVFFFRDPDRVTPDTPNAVISPADGKIIGIEDTDNADYYDGNCKKISIFMSVFNVHVNRVPFTGIVQRISYHPGKFLSANLDKASSDNERNAVFLETENGTRITFVQIAGLVARRIICGLQEGRSVVRGQRFGMICFGSRLDVYVPLETEIKIAKGDVVRAGSSVLGVLK